jgi:hypothetical protein
MWPDTRVTDEVECDQGALRLQRTRFEKNCFHLLDTLGARPAVAVSTKSEPK